MSSYKIWLLLFFFANQIPFRSVPGPFDSKLITAQPVTKLSPGESKIIHIFVQFPESASKGSGQIKTNLNFVSEHLNLQKELSLVGPY